MPYFDKAQAQNVVKKEIMGLKDPSGGDYRPRGRRPQGAVQASRSRLEPKRRDADVRGLVESLPSLPKPAAAPKPIKRLLAATPVFAQDGLIPHANDEAHKHLIDVLNGLAARYAELIDAKAAEIKMAEIKRLSASYGDKSVSHEVDTDIADMNTVNEALRAAKRLLSTSLVNRYWKTVWAAARSQGTRLPTSWM